jgi:hypothetical protein
MRFINRVAIALLLVTLAGTAAMGKTHKSHVKLESAVNINGTVVKPGSYLVVFDEATNEFSLLKNDKLVAKAAARLEQRARKAKGTEVLSRVEGNEAKLISITFGGSNQDVVLAQMGMQAGGNN